MSTNIVDLIRNYISEDLIAQAASYLGESEKNISKAISGLIPTLTAGVIDKGSESQFASQHLLEAAKATYRNRPPGDTDFLAGDTGLHALQDNWTNFISDDQTASISHAIAGFSGIKNTSSDSLISTVVPLIMSFLGKHAVENNLDTTGFSHYLISQKAGALRAIPSELALSGAVSGLEASGSNAGEIIEPAEQSLPANDLESKPVEGGGIKWLLPLLLLAAVAFLLWWVMGKGCQSDAEQIGSDTIAVAPADSLVNTTSDIISGVLDTASGNFIYDVGADQEITLADGTKLNVGEQSTEAKLYRWLSDPSLSVDTIDKTANWIVLDRVYFETGNSVLTETSATQVKNIAAILKNFPNASIKLGGYTDNTGDAAINKKVSDERAKAVAKKLIAAGAGSQQVVEAVGYGQEFPVCEANDTPECKGQNRRVDLKVASK
ncbi:OmpA family protein [Niabella insulamsoli]|uniref:OmpA family protein n=1 Tax=Niabella insulamsoli TaxID=3144874 RepID=UPI0031FDC598